MVLSGGIIANMANVSDIDELHLECPEKWDDDDVPQLTKSVIFSVLSNLTDNLK